MDAENTSSTQNSVDSQKTGLTDMAPAAQAVAPGAQAAITNHEPVLTEQGQQMLEDIKQDPKVPARLTPARMTPQAQATLKALRGH